ncbi:MAG: cation transporter, partial [Candidatus Aminicenantes bacterium]|nr:cation transporter [Candidatus Aminicenantes bacterium]
AFLIAGPATNTVTLSFVYKKLGKKVAVIYLISIVITSIFLGIIFDLITGGVNVSSNVAHTHGENGVGIITLISGIGLLLLLVNSRFDLIKLFRRGKDVEMAKIKVNDISCNHCKMTITNTLKTIKGIGNLEVVVDEKVVRYDGDAELDLVKKMIREAGFNPE